MVPFWISATGTEIAQGDFLSKCKLPIVPDNFGRTSTPADIEMKTVALIVLTQSCDLANAKTGLVALCPIYSVAAFETINPSFSKRGVWEEVRRGRREGLHLLASPTDPSESRQALVVNFREILSLPIGYVREHASNLTTRWRLQSPFLEHFSQAFARFFMRVGLPSAVPQFKD